MGIVSDVPPEVWNYSVSGFKVIKWWLEENQNPYRAMTRSRWRSGT